MKTIGITVLALITAATMAGAQPGNSVDTDKLSTVSPALKSYTEEDLFGRVWQEDALSERDRSLVTVAALIARTQSKDLPAYIRVALDSGVTPAEISETITHLAFYAGWQNAMSAADAAAEVFKERRISRRDLPAANPENMLPLNEEAEARRHGFVDSQYGDVSQGVVDNTAELVFRELWLRPDLAPRDRSLVTVAALISAGHVQQIGFHLNRAMDNGLTKEEASATLSHLAFYAGWPNIFSALPVAGEVFENRGE